jgi:hypothetical protein
MQLSDDQDPPKTWVKSSYSMTNGNCVEVARLSGRVVGVRDSKRPRGHVLRFTAAQWQVFLDGINSGVAD